MIDVSNPSLSDACSGRVVVGVSAWWLAGLRSSRPDGRVIAVVIHRGPFVPAARGDIPKPSVIVARASAHINVGDCQAAPTRLDVVRAEVNRRWSLIQQAVNCQKREVSACSH